VKLAQKFSKEEIIREVEEAECPMMEDLNLEKISKNKLIEHLADSCCPILARLVVEGKTT
jgi:hypothetical protein